MKTSVLFARNTNFQGFGPPQIDQQSIKFQLKVELVSEGILGGTFEIY